MDDGLGPSRLAWSEVSCYSAGSRQILLSINHSQNKTFSGEWGGGFMRFRVALDNYCGPLELLLYLVRKQELDVTELSLSALTEQFLDYVSVLEQIDVEAVGEFLDLASTLIELKARCVLPGEEEEVVLEDPRQELVHRLLRYKQYRDAASLLEERSREWCERYPRRVLEAPRRRRFPDEQAIREVELWDLVSAFGRVLRQRQALCGPESIRFDETPIEVFMRRIHARLREEGRVGFHSFFETKVHKSTLVGMFLAVLEMVRHEHARAWQEELFGEIWLEPGERPLPDELAGVEHGESREQS